MLRITTLGASEIHCERGRIGAEHRMAFALVLILAMRGSTPSSRRELAALLWPAATDRKRNHRLRSLLYRLRDLGLPLLGSTTTIALGKGALDFRDFTALPRSLDQVRASLRLVGPVLPGMAAPAAGAIADALDDARDTIVATMTRWLMHALTIARSAGDWVLADAVSQAALMIDPLNERARLSLDETRETTREHAIIAQSAADASPLLGRDDVMNEIVSAIVRARDGRGNGIVLWGPAGIGKTRILRELLAPRFALLARIVIAEPRPLHSLRPLGIVLDLVARLLLEPGAAGCEPSAYASLREWTGASPNDSPRPADPSEEALYRAFTELLAALADESTLVLALDDLHVADPSIWRFLEAVVRWSADRRILWIFTHRTVRDSERARVPAPASGVLRRIALRWLDRASARALLTTQCGSRSADLEHMLDAAGGHPLLLRELARSGGAPSPELQWLLDDCLARLSSDAFRILRRLATLGTRATPRSLAELSGLSRAELRAALSELEDAGILREDDGLLHAHSIWADAALDTLVRSERIAISID